MNLTTNLRKAIILTAGGALIASGTWIALTPAQAAPATQSMTVSSTVAPAPITIDAYEVDAPLLPACEFEDSTNCIWDATQQGNGLGQSFIDYEGDVYYLDECAGEAIPNPCTPDSNN